MFCVTYRGESFVGARVPDLSFVVGSQQETDEEFYYKIRLVTENPVCPLPVGAFSSKVTLLSPIYNIKEPNVNKPPT